MLKGKRDNSDCQRSVIQTRHGETHSIQRDRTLRDDQMPFMLRKGKRKICASVLIQCFETGENTIYVTLNQVTIQPLIDRNGSFQINRIPLFPAIEGRLAKRLLDC